MGGTAMSSALLIRRRGMMQAATAPPYTRLQYITTTGAQLVITDIVIPSQNTIVKVVCEIKDMSTLSASRIIVSSGKTGESSAYQLYANASAFCLWSASVNKNTSSFFTLTAISNPITGKDTINGNIKNGNGRNHGGQYITLSGFMNATFLSNNQDTKLIQVYFDDVLAADFIPVRIGTVAQWYDQLNNKYWPSQTGTDYVAGPDL